MAQQDNDSSMISNPGRVGRSASAGRGRWLVVVGAATVLLAVAPARAHSFVPGTDDVRGIATSRQADSANMRATAISAGWSESLALLDDGTIAAWGRGRRDEVAPPAGLTGVTAISTAHNHHLALKSDGTVVAWGDNESTQTEVPPTLRDVAAIAAGEDHSLALKKNGKVVAWGDNALKQSKVPAGLDNVAAIAAGKYYSLALRSNGKIVSWNNSIRGGAFTVPEELRDETMDKLTE